ncbi:MAG: glycosyltransferase [Deltaproteobacteria bacterium]|nr:glycosyltransferase [Deltaproteobacteria bacterium]
MQPRILLLNQPDSVMGDVLIRGLRALGTPFQVIDYHPVYHLAASDMDYGLFEKTINAFQPDFLLTFQTGPMVRKRRDASPSSQTYPSRMEDYIRRQNLRLACWLIDYPLSVPWDEKAKQFIGLSSNLTFFCIDPTWVPDLTSLGLKAHYLPYAGCPDIFYQLAVPSDAYDQVVCFVGSLSFGSFSLKGIEETILNGVKAAGLVDAAAFIKEVGQAVDHILARPPESIREIVAQHLAKWELDQATLEDIVCLLTYMSSIIFRISALQSVPQEVLTVYGDYAWQRHLPKARIAGPVKIELLPQIYRRSYINLVANRFHFPYGLTQRDFDIPLAGGLALVDERPGLYDSFDSSELAVYRQLTEIPEKIHFFLANPDIRNELIRHAQKRILAQHTFENRLETLIKLMTDEPQTPVRPPASA